MKAASQEKVLILGNTFNNITQSYERSIEMTSGCSFIGIQKEMMDQVEKLEGKELLNTIVFAKCLLNSLLLSELVKNPEYTALLALHD